MPLTSCSQAKKVFADHSAELSHDAFLLPLRSSLVAENFKGKEVRVTVSTDADIPTMLRAYKHKILRVYNDKMFRAYNDKKFRV